MKDNIDVGAVGTFGLPNGCTQSAFYSGKFIKNKSLDLNANEIKIFPNTSLYALRREMADGEASLLFIKYTFAKEKNSNRGGTFLGSCLCFYNSYANPSQVISLLDEFHADLAGNENNVKDSALQVSHSKDLQVKLPKDFDKLGQHIKPLDPAALFHKNGSPEGNFLVYSQGNSTDKRVKFFQNGLTYFSNSETIYFTEDREIAEYVAEKKLLQLTDFNAFEAEIENIKRRQAEEQRRLENAQAEERRHREEERKALEKKSEDQRRAEQKLKKEEEAKKRAAKNQANAKGTVKPVTQKATAAAAGIATTGDTAVATPIYGAVKKNKPNNTAKKALFYIFIPIISILLLLSNIYFVFFYVPKTEVKEPVVIEHPKPVLNPQPDSELDKAKRQLVFKNSFKGKNIGEVVRLLFQNDSTGISKVYAYQAASYKLHLYEVNKDYFKIGKDTLCISDTIGKIPVFRVR